MRPCRRSRGTACTVQGESEEAAGLPGLQGLCRPQLEWEEPEMAETRQQDRNDGALRERDGGGGWGERWWWRQQSGGFTGMEGLVGMPTLCPSEPAKVAAAWQ